MRPVNSVENAVRVSREKLASLFAEKPKCFEAALQYIVHFCFYLFMRLFAYVHIYHSHL
jgi:hypothetical protein